MKTGELKVTKTNNYARFIPTGAYLFFDDSFPPNFRHPELWAFDHVPRGTDPEYFRGQLVGVNPPASDTQAPASAAS